MLVALGRGFALNIAAPAAGRRPPGTTSSAAVSNPAHHEDVEAGSQIAVVELICFNFDPPVRRRIRLARSVRWDQRVVDAGEYDVRVATVSAEAKGPSSPLPSGDDVATGLHTAFAIAIVRRGETRHSLLSFRLTELLRLVRNDDAGVPSRRYTSMVGVHDVRTSMPALDAHWLAAGVSTLTGNVHSSATLAVLSEGNLLECFDMPWCSTFAVDACTHGGQLPRHTEASGFMMPRWMLRVESAPHASRPASSDMESRDRPPSATATATPAAATSQTPPVAVASSAARAGLVITPPRAGADTTTTTPRQQRQESNGLSAAASIRLTSFARVPETPSLQRHVAFVGVLASMEQSALPSDQNIGGRPSALAKDRHHHHHQSTATAEDDTVVVVVARLPLYIYPHATTTEKEATTTTVHPAAYIRGSGATAASTGGRASPRTERLSLPAIKRLPAGVVIQTIISPDATYAQALRDGWWSSDTRVLRKSARVHVVIADDSASLFTFVIAVAGTAAEVLSCHVDEQNIAWASNSSRLAAAATVATDGGALPFTTDTPRQSGRDGVSLSPARATSPTPQQVHHEACVQQHVQQRVMLLDALEVAARVSACFPAKSGSDNNTTITDSSAWIASGVNVRIASSTQDDTMAFSPFLPRRDQLSCDRGQVGGCNGVIVDVGLLMSRDNRRRSQEENRDDSGGEVVGGGGASPIRHAVIHRAVMWLPQLCHLPSHAAPALPRDAQQQGRVAAGCPPRTVDRWLFLSPLCAMPQWVYRTNVPTTRDAAAAASGGHPLCDAATLIVSAVDGNGTPVASGGAEASLTFPHFMVSLPDMDRCEQPLAPPVPSGGESPPTRPPQSARSVLPPPALIAALPSHGSRSAACFLRQVVHAAPATTAGTNTSSSARLAAVAAAPVAFYSHAICLWSETHAAPTPADVVLEPPVRPSARLRRPRAQVSLATVSAASAITAALGAFAAAVTAPPRMSQPSAPAAATSTIPIALAPRRELSIVVAGASSSVIARKTVTQRLDDSDADSLVRCGFDVCEASVTTSQGPATTAALFAKAVDSATTGLRNAQTQVDERDAIIRLRASALLERAANVVKRLHNHDQRLGAYIRLAGEEAFRRQSASKQQHTVNAARDALRLTVGAINTELAGGGDG